MKTRLPMLLLLLCSVACLGEEAPSRLHFRTHGFSIAALEGASETAPHQALVMYLPGSEGFTPNVNVQIQPYPGTIKDYAALSRQQFKAMGLAVLLEKVDGKAGVVFECAGTVQERELHFYTKVELHHAKAYLVTATATESQWRSLSAKLKACVDSLRIDKGEPPSPDLSSGDTEPLARPQGTVLCDKRFTLLAPGEEARTIGTYRIRGYRLEAGERIEIIEDVTLEYRGKRAEYRSSVMYTTAPALTPVKAVAETKSDGQLCMKGSVEFEAKTLSFSCVGFLDASTGEKIDPPKRYARETIAKPDGVLVFQSVLPVIGPRLLAKTGEAKDIVFIEFPDDLKAPELVTLKQNHRIVRTAPDENGRYAMKILSPHADRPVSEVRFDRNDKLLSIPSFGRYKLVAATENASPAGRPAR